MIEPERYKAVPPKAKLRKLPKFKPRKGINKMCFKCGYIVAPDHTHIEESNE